ncbi:unnamed protein product, partial [Ectocarpus sp. 12 AP-2014]
QRDEDDEQQGGAPAVDVEGGAGRGAGEAESVRKEMYLIKWKNLSYLHNSWEMAAHLQDPRHPSNRQKLLRFNNKMEQEHGPQWRKVMEDEDAEEGAAEKEYYPSDMAEVQRIVTCEATSTAHEAVLRKERHDMLSGDSAAAAAGAAPAAGGMDDDDDSDPDSLVLYLVKWRGLPYDQCSWEHFKDIRF